MDTSASLLHSAGHELDAEAWTRLTQIYTPLLQRWLRRYEVPSHDAEDLTQEVLLYVAEQLPRFEHSGRTGAFRCWLRQILVHRLRKFWTQRGRQPMGTGHSGFLAELHQIQDPNSGLSQFWNKQHDQHVLSTLLELIRPRFEEKTWWAFQLVVFEQKKPAEVGEQLGLSPHAVSAAKCRVLSVLRQVRHGLIG